MTSHRSGSTLESLPGLSAEPREVAPGVFGARLRLPFALDHVNVWLLEDGDGVTVIDCGLADQRSRAFWADTLDGFCRQRSITRILATHFHPDHMGLIGWLCRATGAPLWTSREEWQSGRLLALDHSDTFLAAIRAFDHAAGLDMSEAALRAERGNAYAPRVVPPPPVFTRLRAGESLSIGGRSWQVVVGEGHAPAMVCLYAEADRVFIAADQVLPRISPHIGVYPNEPQADPLGDFLRSNEALKDLPADCLVLPSHGEPFVGLHERIDVLARHHAERLDSTLEACARAVSVRTVMRTLFPRPLDVHQFGFALGETIAHLNHLVRQGLIVRETTATGVWMFRRR